MPNPAHLPDEARSPLTHPTQTYQDGTGYTCVETSDEWKEMCRPLPCFTAIQWPGYETKVIEDRINGEDVVIQLWKGNCQKFLGRKDYPGGIGAEVGIYRRIPDKKLPKDLSFVPEPLRFILMALNHVDGKNLWWPYPELQTKITLTMMNRTTGLALLSTGPETTYWLNRWMMPDEYARYKADRNNHAPAHYTDFRLEFTINGKEYPSW